MMMADEEGGVNPPSTDVNRLHRSLGATLGEEAPEWCLAEAGRKVGWLQPRTSALQDMLSNTSLCSMKGKHILGEMPRKTPDVLLTF